LFLETWLATIERDPQDIAVVCYRGEKLSLLFRNFSVEEHFPNVNRFGFFLDAEDKTAADKAQSISHLLIERGVIPAGTALAAGTPASIGGKRIAVCVSPDNLNSGFIEHIAMREVLTKPLGPCLTLFENCLRGTSGKPVNPKTLVQAYLGALNPRLCGTGRGFEAGILEVMHHAYDQVRATLTAVL
jgi:hypothetical protein